MSITSGYTKYKRYQKLSDGTYQLVSQWTSSNTVHFDDGATAEAKIATMQTAIDGVNTKVNNLSELSAKQVEVLNERIDNLQQKAKNIISEESPLYISTWFRSNDDISTYLYFSNDGKKWSKVRKTPMFDARDVCPIYINGKFYFITRTVSRDLDVFISNNLIDFERKTINFQWDNNNQKWAPEWFIDNNGDIYVIFSLEIGSMNDSESGKSYTNLRPYISKCNNIDTLSFTNPEPLNVADVNYIDPCIINNDGKYYMFIKKERNENGFMDGSIHIYTSTSLRGEWELVKSGIDTINDCKYEAPSVIKSHNGEFILYIDNYNNDDHKSVCGNMHYMVSSDLLNWSNPVQIQDNSFGTRHGGVLCTNEPKIKQIVSSIVTVERSGMTESDKWKTNPQYVRLPDANSQITVGKYVELFEIKILESYKNAELKFKLINGQSNTNSSVFSIMVNRTADSMNITCTEEMEGYYAISLGNIVVTKIYEDTVKVYYRYGSITTNMTPLVKPISFIGHIADFKCNENIRLISDYEGDNVAIYLCNNIKKFDTGVNIFTSDVGTVLESSYLSCDGMIVSFFIDIILNDDYSEWTKLVTIPYYARPHRYMLSHITATVTVNESSTQEIVHCAYGENPNRIELGKSYESGTRLRFNGIFTR